MGMGTTKESAVVRACLDYLRLRGLLAFRANNVGVWDPVKKAHRSFRGLRGVSDILGVLPRTLDVGGRRVRVGLFLAVECKAGKGRLTPEQEAFANAVSNAGGIALCVRSVGDLAEELERLEGTSC